MPEEEIKLNKYFFDLLSRRDYSERELTSKAIEKGYKKELISKSLDYLKSKNFLNEERLATNLVEHYGQNKGRKWLSQKLQTRLLGREIIEEVLNQYHEEIPHSLKQKIAIKYKVTNWQQIEPSLKQKILGFLARQGYSSPYRILESWQNPESYNYS